MRKLEKLTYPLGIHRLLDKLSAQSDCVFLWIPKTAGTSLWNELETYGGRKLKDMWSVRHRFSNRGIVTFGHMSYLKLLNAGYVDTSFHEKAFKFAIVRDPYDRAVSLFEYLKRIKRLESNESFAMFCDRLKAGEVPDIGFANSEGISHCNPQSTWLLDNDGNILADYVGKLETFGQDIREIRKRLGLVAKKPILRMNTSERRQTEEYYSDVYTQRTIEQFYEEDFDRFNYRSRSFCI